MQAADIARNASTLATAKLASATHARLAIAATARRNRQAAEMARAAFILDAMRNR